MSVALHVCAKGGLYKWTLLNIGLSHTSVVPSALTKGVLTKRAERRKDREVHSGGVIVGVGGQVFSSQCSARITGTAGGNGETDGEGILQVNREKWDVWKRVPGREMSGKGRGGVAWSVKSARKGPAAEESDWCGPDFKSNSFFRRLICPASDLARTGRSHASPTKINVSTADAMCYYGLESLPYGRCVKGFYLPFIC